MPILVLLNAQNSKTYFEWAKETSEIDTATTWSLTNERKSQSLPIYQLALVGTKLRLIGEDDDELTIDLINEPSIENTESIQLVSNHLKFNDNISISSNNMDMISRLYKLCLLSIFEHFAIFKSLTGSIISVMGLRIFDMHIIMNSQFNFKDWCEIYLPGKGWIKTWCYIKKKKNGKREILFYKSNKSMSSQNLICFISTEVAPIQDLFFYNDYDSEVTSLKFDGINSFLNHLKTIKIVGNVSFTDNDIDSMDSGSSSSSISINDDTTPESTPRRKFFSPSKKGHARTGSRVSSMSMKSNKSVRDNFSVSPASLLVRPTPHKGIHHLETLIRFIIPMMDATELYGRPKQFKNERSDPDSLMFGLPRLPNIDYLAKEEISLLMDTDIEVTGVDSIITETNSVALNWFTSFLAENFQRTGDRDNLYLFNTLADLSIDHNTLISIQHQEISQESFYGTTDESAFV